MRPELHFPTTVNRSSYRRRWAMSIAGISGRQWAIALLGLASGMATALLLS
jgi:hypothetical protein